MGQRSDVFTVLVVDRRRLEAEKIIAQLREQGLSGRRVPDLEAAAATVTPAVVTTTAAASGRRAERPVTLWSLPTPRLDAMALARVRRLTPGLRLVARGDEVSARAQSELLLAGAAGFIESEAGAQLLAEILRRVFRGERCFPAAALSAGIDALQNPEAVKASKRDEHRGELTAREQAIARHVALGEANKEIATQLQVSVSTVKTHLQNIFAKLGIDSRVGLALYALAQPQSFGMEMPAAPSGHLKASAKAAGC